MKKQFKSKDFHGAAFVVFPSEEKALESATGGKASGENDKQARKEKRKEDLEKKTSEHLEKLNSENLTGAVIHLAGRK